jgi:hypothetical protein
LAFLTVLAHGLIHSASAQETLWRAALALGMFAVIGCVAGQIAGRIVEDAVRGRLTTEIARRAADNPAAKTR